ncbi:MAG TPA: M17 family peptidase N-terminal domain-containing protein, partial [Actinomycetota bacterium]|nr:M17 family peptidase N-terminal domain-containing protein [Actinomycetota bacterium]
MATFVYSTDPPATVRTDLLVLPVYEGPEAGPGIKDVKGTDLMALYAEAKLKGKKGEPLLVPNTGGLGIAAASVLLVPVGKRRDVTADSLRRALGRV